MGMGFSLARCQNEVGREHAIAAKTFYAGVIVDMAHGHVLQLGAVSEQCQQEHGI